MKMIEGLFSLASWNKFFTNLKEGNSFSYINNYNSRKTLTSDCDIVISFGESKEKKSINIKLLKDTTFSQLMTQNYTE